MKKLFLLAWPIALAAVSCSNEEVVSVNNDANEITFAAVVNNATRANTDSMYCNNWKPGSFHVWALAKDADNTVVGKTSYFQEVRYDANAGKSLWSAADQANIRFWPNEGASMLDFYIMHNYNGSIQWKPTEATTTVPRLAVEGYTLTNDVAKQEDFIYSVLQNQTKPDNVGTVGINFRHALSQVVFKARNTNKSIHVEIGEVYVKNFYNKGNFALPLLTTDNNLVDHNSTNKEGSEGVITPNAGTVGTWTNVTADAKVSTSKVAVYPTKNSANQETAAEPHYAVVKYTANSSEATNLTDGVDTGVKATRDFSKAMLFIPQTLTKGETVPSGTGKVDEDKTNPYFVIKCKIWNVDGGADGTAGFDKDHDVCIYDGYAYIPVDATWEAGKKYIYTFVFGGRNGGYDEDGKDVLVPISFTVTVDDFTPIVEKDVNMFQ